jgi:mono/diheme cytochrome c family protein
MSSSNQKPDLEESINVTEAHDRVSRDLAAAAREKKISENGMEPVSLWVFLACGVVLLIAGGVLGGGGSLFNYGATFREGYVRAQAPGVGVAGPEPRPALQAFASRGARIYSTKCNGCHGGDGRGDGANFPTLVGSDWVVGDSQRLAMVIINGVQGPISTGRAYGPGVMPAQGIGMTPEELAALMTYLRNDLGNAVGDVVSVDMAVNAFELSAARPNPGQPVTAEELDSDHAADLPGEQMDPEILVNPVNLQPVADEAS